ncbi:MFS transporter [Actinomyces naeslundii]|uniref:MFS transporter n=3 Tax=Actinomyces naeslundii TaxID=1655 RepID=A0A854EHM7_ACTNA|nr:MFS transporter [Actinomyces naeslundii]OMG21431.1 MFS transporter [Actinomyces naeslundii]OMG27764.1 MFS transporter [Actinomyces naeslundii]OMG31496.1 MFS transporter [Actinomyces naeslundii]OMG37629.1 MFS transporter [Actinomyces naeslundii]OMG38819.1 MFS transporter [Actinomyces naeslundii]
MPSSPPPARDTNAPEHQRLLPTLLIPAFVTLLAVSSVNVILPAVSQDLSAGTAGLQLVVSGYSLVFGVVLVPAGRAGDVMGRGRIFVIGMILFGVGSLASGLAPDIVTLNLARVVMGVGSGLLNPQVAGMIQQYYSGESRGRAFGLFGAVIGVSVAVGPVLSGGLIGWLGDDWGWRASFLINVPLVLLGVWAAHRYLPDSAWHRQDGGSGAGRDRVDLDPVGMVLLAAGTLLIMIPFMEASAGAWVWGLEAAGIGIVSAWVVWERRYRARGGAPMVDLSLLAIPSFAYGSLAIAVYFLGYTSVWIIVAQYVQAGLGSTALVSGAVGVPAALAGSVAAAVAGRRVIRVGRVMVLGGMAAGMAGLLASVGIIHMHARAGWSPWWLTLTLLLLGVGQGLVVSPNQTLSLVDVPLEYAGAAGGILQTGERIGTSIGIAAITGLTFRVSHSSGWDVAAQVGLLAVVAAIAVSAAIAAVDLRLAARRRR